MIAWSSLLLLTSHYMVAVVPCIPVGVLLKGATASFPTKHSVFPRKIDFRQLVGFVNAQKL